MHSSDSPYQTGWCHWGDTSSYSELLSDIIIVTAVRDLITLTDRVKLCDVVEETHPVAVVLPGDLVQGEGAGGSEDGGVESGARAWATHRPGRVLLQKDVVTALRPLHPE